MRLFSKPVRTFVACLCAYASAAPAFAAFFGQIPDNGTNLSSGNSVASTSNASVHDYSPNALENFAQVLLSVVGADLGVDDIKNVTGVLVTDKIGVVNWNRLNVDAGKTMWIMNGMKENTTATLYNIVKGGTPTTIAGQVSSSLNSELTEAFLAYHKLFAGEGFQLGTGAVNVWLINPAGISVSSGATIDLNGYLGLVAGSMSSKNESGATFNTDNATGSITIDSDAYVNSPGGLYLIGNDIQASALISARTLAANGNDVSATFSGSSIKGLTSSQSTIDKMSISGVFRSSLGVSAARNLELGELSVSGVADIKAQTGSVTIQDSLRLYDMSGKSKLTAYGDISLSGGTVANNSKLTIASTAGNVSLDSSDNDFLGGISVSAVQGTATIGGTKLTDSLLQISTKGDISLHEYSGSINLPKNNGNYVLSMSDAQTAKLSLATDGGSITLNNVRGWNGRLGQTTANGGDVAISTSQGLVLLGDVTGNSVSLSGNGIATAVKSGALSAGTGDISLSSTAGIDLNGNWNVSAENGTATFANAAAGDLVIGRSYLEADDTKVNVTAKRVEFKQQAEGDLVIEESATVEATGKTEANGGMLLEHKGDLYVFGKLTVDEPDPEKGYDPETAQPLGYLLPEIKSTGTGRVKAMSLDMRGRDYSLSEAKSTVDSFGTWDSLEYVRLYNLGENFIVDKNMRLVSGTAGTRTGNRASTVFEGAGDLTVSFGGTELHAEQTGLRLAAASGRTLTLNGAGGLIETGSKSLNLAGSELKTDGLITIKAGTLALSDGIDVDLSGNKNVFVDKLSGTAGDVSIKASAYLDADDFRLAGDFEADSLTLDTGATVSSRRNFIGGTAADGITDDSDLYNLSVNTLNIALKEDAKLYFKSDRNLTVNGLADSSGAEALTTVSDLRYSTTAGLRLAGNETEGTLTVTSLGEKKATGDIYLRETQGSMDVTKPVATQGAATFIASNKGQTLKFADTPNDIDGEIRIAASETADIDFSNYGAIVIRRVTGNDVKLTSVNNDITISSEAAYVQGLLTLTAEKGNITVGTQSAEKGLWSGRLGAATAQGTVEVDTARELVLEGDITAGEAVLSGAKGIDANGHRIVLTDQNKVPRDEYIPYTTGKLTVRANKGAVKLADTAQHVKEFSGTARDGIEFRNDQDLTVGQIKGGNGDVSIATTGDITVEDAVTAYDVTLHAAEKIDFADDGYVAVSHGTKFVVDYADFTLDLQAIQSRDMREAWNLGVISVQAGSEDHRYDVSIIGNDTASFSVGEIVAKDVSLVSKKDLKGDSSMAVRAEGNVRLEAGDGDIAIVGASALEGVVTATALKGDIQIATAGTLTIGDMTAQEEKGVIDLKGASILSDGFAKRTLAADTLNLRATDAIVLDLAGAANLNRVTAKTARLTANDDGASLTIADGSIDNLTAKTAGNLSVVNDRNLGLGAVTAGGTADFSVNGSITQDGSLDENGRMDVAGKATFAAKGDIYLDNPYNAFGSSVDATATGNAVFSVGSGSLVFDSLTAAAAEVYAGEAEDANIVIKASDVESLLAEAGGNLTVDSTRTLKLRGVEVGSMNLTSARDIVGSEKIVTKSDAATSVLTAGGAVELTNEKNELKTVAVTAEDKVTIRNNADLTLKGVDAQSLALDVKGKVTSTDLIATRATAKRPNVIEATDGISLTHKRNELGEYLEVKSDGLVNLVNSGDLDLEIGVKTPGTQFANLNIANDGNLDVTASSLLKVGKLDADRLSVTAQNGLWGDANSVVTVRGTTSLTAPVGGIKLLGEKNEFADTVTASAPNGSIVINTSGDLKIGDMTAGDRSEESTANHRKIELTANMITGDERLRLRASEVNLVAKGGDGRIELDFLGDTELNRVSADVAELTTDGGLTIADGSVNTLTATTGDGLTLVNDKSVVFAGLDVGGSADVRVTAVGGTISQRAGDSVTIQGNSAFGTQGGDIILDGNFNIFSREIAADAKGTQATAGDVSFNAPSALAFTTLTAKDATLSSSEGAVSVADGHIESLEAKASGTLTVANGQDLTLKAVEAKTMSLDVAGKIEGHDKIVTKATTDNPNVIDAEGTVTLDNEKNLLTAVKVEAVKDDAAQTVSLTDNGPLTVTTRSAKPLEVGSIVAQSLTIDALNGIHGESTSKVVSDDRLDLTATFGSIYLDGEKNAFQTLAAKAPNGDVYVRNSKSTKIEEITTSEDGKTTIKTDGTLSSDGKLRLNGKADFTADDIRIDFAGSADLGIVEANTVKLTALDEGSSLTIESGAMNELAAQTDQDLDVRNTKDLIVDDVTVGRNATFDVDGTLSQKDGTIVSVAGTTKLTTDANLVLDSTANHFGGAVTVNAGEGATVKAADGLEFAALAAKATTLETEAGDITVKNGAITGTMTARAADGSVKVDNGDTTLTIGDVTASEAGQVVLAAKNLASDGQVAVSGGTIDLEAAAADGDVKVAFKDSVKLNKVVAHTANLKATDADASLEIAAGSVDQLSAETAGKLTVANGKDLTLGATTVGGDADLNVTGTLGQDGALKVTGATALKASDGISLANAANEFGGAISAEAANQATVAAANGLTFSSLKAKDADLRGGAGNVVVTAGNVETLAATADGNLAFVNEGSLTLRDIDVAALAIAAAGDLAQTGTILTDPTAANLIAADGNIVLTDAGNDFGDTLNVSAGGDTALANTGNLNLNLLTEGNFSVVDRGDLNVTASSVAGGRFETQGGNLTIAATALGSSSSPVEIVSDRRIDVRTTGDATLRRTDGGWTLGSAGGSLSVGGNLDLAVNGLLGTQGATLAALGDIKLQAHGYLPQVNLYLGGQTLDVEQLGGFSNWAMFKLQGGNTLPHLVVHPATWVVLDGRITPTHPDYAYITAMDQDHLTSTPLTTPTSSVFGQRYFSSDNELGGIDLVGLGRYPYITYDNNTIEYTTKE